jgi:hypothetical protein
MSPHQATSGAPGAKRYPVRSAPGPCVLGPDGGPDPFALGDPHEVMVRHRALGALVVDAVAPATELGVHPRAATAESDPARMSQIWLIR